MKHLAKSDSELLKPKILHCIIRVSLGIISERNDADRTAVNGIITAVAWVTALCFASLNWAAGCLVSIDTCFTFPLLLGLSIYFGPMLRRPCPS